MSSTETPLFVVSIDLEMSWGVVHHGGRHDRSPYLAEREVVSDVLDLMDEYSISATWAIVGHLFLSGCQKVDGIKHPGIVRPAYPWMSHDWYRDDPTADVSVEPTWYGPDLVDMVSQSKAGQEIGSHSFGHILVGDPACSEEAFASDLRAAQSVAASRKIELRSFVYPRNSIGHLHVLAEHGFTAYRGRVDGAVGGPVRPTRHAGMVKVPHTYFFDPDSRNANLLGTRGWAWLLRRRLSDAIDSGSMLHIWFHTHNLSPRRDRARRSMESLFSAAREAIDKGDLLNMTMGEIADDLETADAV
jgi:hypothetical protein